MHKTQLPFCPPQVSAAAWAIFDAEWYARTYLGDAPGAVARAQDHYLTIGMSQAHGPNPYFDEQWFRLRYPDVAAAIAAGDVSSGFESYCRASHETRSPHWLFDTAFYLNSAPALTGYANAYDHFLRVGDKQLLRPSPFFLAETLLGQMGPESEAQARHSGCYVHVLATFPFPGMEPRFSPYFDPVWYLRHDPAAAAAVLRGKVPSALAHYLLHQGARHADPLEQFSESFYLAQHADVAAAVAAGIYASGYAHFLDFGIAEGRRFHPDARFALPAPSALDRGRVLSQRAPDAFARLVMRGHGNDAAALADTEPSAKDVFRRKAAQAARAATRSPLDFTCDHTPKISVIIVLHNKLELTLAVLAELQDHMPGMVEVILVDSGSTDGTVQIASYLTGARVIRFEQNVNFIAGCNAGLAEARGEAVLYLNNDVRLGPRALKRAFDRLYSEPNIGAVGGMVIRSHGLLQEAGCIIWRDGFTDGYLRDASPLVPEAGFVRDVDFCSGVFLMVRRDLAGSLGGFDPIFSPAYYEETDFCVRLRQAGWRIVYDPGVRIEHLEYGSARGAAEAVNRIETNQRIFAERHRDWLEGQPDRAETCQALARLPSTARTQTRVLFIEDQLPLRNLGSGFVRSNDIVHAMIDAGFGLTIYPMQPPPDGALISRRDFPETAELIDDRGTEELEAFLAERPGYFDRIWIGRTHNFDRLAPLLRALRARLPAAQRPKIVLDTEAVAAVRLQQRLEILGDVADLGALLAQEFRNIDLADKVVAVSKAEASLLIGKTRAKPQILGHMRRPRLDTPDEKNRRDLLFVGAMHRRDSPNYESLEWFIGNALDPLVALLGSDIMLTVIGHTGPEVDLSVFAHHPNVRVLGSVADLAPHYDSHRVFIAPTRIAAGIPYKLHEAASEGIAIVATDLLAAQLGWTHGRHLLTASGLDGATFAAEIARLYRDPDLWRNLRDGAMQMIQREASPTAYARQVKSILR